MKISDYLLKIENQVIFYPSSDETWQAIQDNGMLDDMAALTKNEVWEGELKLEEDDKQGLLDFNTEVVEKFNQLELEVKSQYNLKRQTLIDYQSGRVLIIQTRL